MRILVDECLSPKLADLAHSLGLDAYHVAHRGWSGMADPEILRLLLAEELVVVTNNRDDFAALLGKEELHPGMIVIVDNVRRDDQLRLFAIALKAAMLLPSMLNKIVEIGTDETVEIYDLPDAQSR